MFENLSLTSLTSTLSKVTNRLWDTTKRYLTIAPEPLWQKAIHEPDYQAYLRFKSDLTYRPELAFRAIVSPYAVISNPHIDGLPKRAIRRLLQSNPSQALNYFYDDIINHLVELSASALTIDGADFQAFEGMLEFYERFVPGQIYQRVLTDVQVLDKSNLQTSIMAIIKKINPLFKSFPLDLKPEISEEKPVPENPGPYHTVNVKQLMVMGAIGLLANKNNLGLGILSLATTALLAEPVGAAFPTVTNPIPTQYAEVGQAFSYDIDLNQVFNDTDGDIMTFGGVTMADGSSLPSWLTAAPIKLSGRDYANDAYDVAVVDDLVYLANGQYGLLIFNISNSNQKVFVSSLDTPGIARRITVQNGVAYVADSSGLKLINVSNAFAPSLLSSYVTPSYGQGVTVQNDIAYVVEGSSGLQLINVSNVSVLRLLSSYDDSSYYALDVVVQNGVAYVANTGSGLQLINVSNASALRLLGNYVPPYYAQGVAVQNEVVYVADFTNGLQLINVSNASAPSLLNTCNPSGSGNAFHVTVQNGVAYVSEVYIGLQLINVSNASAPRLLGTYNTPGGSISSIAVQNGVAYVTEGDYGFQLINVSNASAPRLLDTYLDYPAYGVAAQSGIVYMAGGYLGLQLINVSNASMPRLLGIYNTLDYAYGVAVQSGVAYVAEAGSGLQLINVINSSAPRLLGIYNTPGSARGVAVQNGVAYVADDTSGLQLINVSNASASSFLGAYDTPGNAYSVTVQNGVAYVADGASGLQLINVSNASAPSFLGAYDTPGTARGVAVQNGVAYVADDIFGLQLIDVSNVSAPSLLGSYDTPGTAYDVAVQNGMAYVADYGFGLQLINVNNISMPRLLGTYNTPGNAQAIVVQNGVAYVADAGGGLQIIDLDNSQLAGVVPFNATGNYSFKVYATNTNGEWVSTELLLITNPTQSNSMPTSESTQPTSVPSSPSSLSTNPPSSTTGPASFSSSQPSNSFSFNIIASSNPVVLESDTATVLTTDSLTFSGNINSDQVIYTVQGNNPDIVITVNGTETNQFTQADVEGNFVEIALNGVTCGDYSTDLQLEANVVGSNASPQRVDVSLIFQGTTCTDAGRLSVFLFRDANIGFWAQRRDNDRNQQEPSFVTVPALNFRP